MSSLNYMANVTFPFYRFPLSLLLLVWCGSCLAQDTAPLSEVNQQIQRTTRFALVIPGAGQIINKKYWKAPIVWGAFGYCVSAIQYNQQRLTLYRNTIIADSKGEELPDPSLAGTASSWRQMETFYQKNRDLSFLSLIGVHLLSVLDAHVDANLLAFDVGENLSLHLAPIGSRYFSQGTALGLKLNWQLTSDARTYSNQQHLGKNPYKLL